MSPHVIQLEPDSHTYTVNGMITPGFSEIVKGVGLVDDRWWDDQSRWRGSVVHTLCQLDDENDIDETWIDEQGTAEELRGYLEAYRRFKRETQFVPEGIEQSVFCSSMNYCGTLDRTGLANGRPVLIDLKTGAVTRITRYQTTAYASALPNSFNYLRGAVGLKPSGKYSCVWYEPKDYRKDHSKWASVVDVYWLLKEFGMLKGSNNEHAGNGNGATNGEYGAAGL